MALNITIVKVPVATSFAAGAKVAAAAASGGIAPYTYNLVTGLDKFTINSSTGTITTKNLMDSTNAASFSVIATDSTASSVISDVTYPLIRAAIQNMFYKSDTIYKITNDINLGGSTLTIPSDCTLDFQGGSFSNGTITFSNTTIVANSSNYIFKNIIFKGSLKCSDFYVDWVGASVSNEDNSDFIKQAVIVSSTFRVPIWYLIL